MDDDKKPKARVTLIPRTSRKHKVPIAALDTPTLVFETPHQTPCIRWIRLIHDPVLTDANDRFTKTSSIYHALVKKGKPAKHYATEHDAERQIH